MQRNLFSPSTAFQCFVCQKSSCKGRTQVSKSCAKNLKSASYFSLRVRKIQPCRIKLSMQATKCISLKILTCSERQLKLRKFYHKPCPPTVSRNLNLSRHVCWLLVIPDGTLGMVSMADNGNKGKFCGTVGLGFKTSAFL